MKTLQFGIIGLGHFGKHYARLLQENPDVQLVAVANKSGEVFKKGVISLPENIKTSLDANEIIGDTRIDCVVIATPPSTHARLIVKALRAGKHVFVEKPMVIRVAETNAIKKELKKNKKLVFMVGFQYVYNDYIQYLKSHINELGSVKYVLGENLYCGPFRADVGSFMDAAVHDCAVLEYLFSPGKVVKVAGARRSIGKTKNDDFGAVSVVFQNGLMVHLLTSWYWPEKVRKITVVGGNGMVLFNDRDENKLKSFSHKYPVWDKKQSSLFLPGMVDQPAVAQVIAREPLKNELDHFIECIKTGKTPTTGFDFGYKVTKMMEQISMRMKKL